MSTVDELVKRAEGEGWGWDGDMRSETESLDFIHGLLRCLKPEVVVETDRDLPGPRHRGNRRRP